MAEIQLDEISAADLLRLRKSIDDFLPQKIEAEKRELKKRHRLHNRKNVIEAIAEALASSGCRSLDQQTKALGLPRATAWTIISKKHKVGRLSKRTTDRILANPDTPPAVRAVVQEYLADNYS